MKTLLHITFAKIRRSMKKSVFQSVAVFASMFVISFLVCFIVSIEEFRSANPTFGIEAVGGESEITIYSLKEFFSNIISGISFVAVAVVVLSAISLSIYSRLRMDENKRFFATLTSIGATNAQRKIISVTETLILYELPIILGSFLGMLPSAAFTDMIARIFVDGYSHRAVPIFIPLIISVLGIVMVLIFTYVPSIKRKNSVIESVKAHNEKEAGEAHNYRKSYTFRHMPVEQRIAKKSVEYYKSAYRRITFMFISCVLYPVLAIMFFVIVSRPAVIDYTPNYGVDVMKLVELFAKNIAIFGASAFLALTAFAVLQTVYIIAAQNRVRRETLTTYKSIGMTDSSIKKVLAYEYKTAVFHAVIYLVFILTLLFVGINAF